MKTKSEKRKVTVQLWAPLLKKLNQMATEACLNRDAYLDVVLANEAQAMASELAGKRNSGPARAYVKQCFLQLKELKSVSLTLQLETADAIGAACDEVNVWRDIFVNRVIYLLVAKSSAVEAQFGFKFDEFRDEIFDEGFEVKALLLGPRLAAIRNFITDDPFLGMRAALKAFYGNDTALHAQPLGHPLGKTPKERGLAGFSTYLEDLHVPGTTENDDWEKDLEDLLDDAGQVNEGATK